MFRIAQEALANVAKHADATRTALTLSYTDEVVMLDIRDDGRGFVPQAAADGFGLEGMRRRARAVGGTLEVETGPGRGTAVAAAVPKPSAAGCSAGSVCGPMDEFRMRGGGLARFAAPFAAPLVLFFAVCLLLGAVLTGSSALGVVIGALATAALFGVLAVKHRRLVAGTVVRFSDEGVELADSRGFRVRLRWPDLTRIDVVDTQLADPRSMGRPGGARVRVQALRSVGLVGWGERTLPPRVPGWMRERLARVPADPATGRPEVAIPLGEIDPLWERGPMGDWVRRHRPDLMR
ncbi:ATP-binding protein [Nonomuraea sp. WAC 01424]|uniref:ATP-binding protein n=1 Tax=Nonomuraea sp. WAC 01424 TaxID=2203200 RepID=UPI0021AD823F|nr:ATP-binding protein [Nonomuraea sp. WAC 01424]